MRLMHDVVVAMSALTAGLALTACATAGGPHSASVTASNSTAKPTTAKTATGKPVAITASPAATASQAASVTSVHVIAGNPDGHAYVPPAARAVNTRHPNHVIGSGTPASCTSAAVVNAVAKGGVITFNCGPKR
jgi:hypothetical protein